MGLNLNKLEAAFRTSGISKQYIADRLGKDKSTVSRWFNGVAEPETLDKLKELAAILGTTLAALTDDGDAAATPKERLLLDLFRQQNETQASAFLAFLASQSNNKP